MKNSKNFIARSRSALENPTLQSALQRAGGGFINARQLAADDEPDFEIMRDQAQEVRQRSLKDLDIYLAYFEKQVINAGGHIHWAETTEDLRRIVIDICNKTGAKHITKGKSMVSEEAHLNDALERAGITPWETDLGEYIIQLAHEPPSHIVVPALHKTKEDIADLFLSHHALGERDLTEVQAIVNEARSVIRERFINADVGITGANMLIAETGTAVLCTNEGNGDLTASLPKTHIITTSFDRVIPTWEDASKIIRVLARSATGQKITSYTSFFSGPKSQQDMDGPEEFHIVLLNNHRTEILKSEFKEMLHCIRCGACMNHCPVYKTVGGHTYDSVYPGPMGSVLSPLLRGYKQDDELPNASTFCGRCVEVCPVRIPLTSLMRKLRDKEFAAQRTPILSRLMIKTFSAVALQPKLYRHLSNLAAKTLHLIAGNKGYLKKIYFLNGWTQYRNMPAPQGSTFQQQWQEQQAKKKGQQL